jgi:PAS domain S-box-containing protein
VSSSPEEIAALRQELDETNRGLIALYAELETARAIEARLAAIVLASDDAMYSITSNRTIGTWNPGAERLLGYAADEAIGQPVEAFVPPGHRAELADALDRLAAGERSLAFDTWRWRKDGTLVEVAVTLSAMRDHDDSLLGFAAVQRDLTERRLAEAELAAARAAQEVMTTRERFALDLQDGAIQAIFAASMRLQATATMSNDAVMRKRLEEVVGQLDAVIADLRRHAFGVRRRAE